MIGFFATEEIVVHSAPQGPGAGDGTLHVKYHGEDGVAHDTTIALAWSATAAPSMMVTLSSGTGGTPALQGASGGTVVVPVYVSSASSAAAIIGAAGGGSVKFSLTMNENVLTPISCVTKIPNASVISFQPGSGSGAGDGTLHAEIG